MINFVVEKLSNDKDLRYNLAEKYQFVMLDEYQDTNNPQNKVMDLILSVSPHSISPNGREVATS